jgi:hypothetical protein
MPLPPISGMELLSLVISVAEGRPTCFSSIGIAVIHTHTHIYIYIYWKTYVFTPLCSQVPNRSESGSQDPD